VKLLNGKPGNSKRPKNQHGIGISNVRKRLELLYPGKYELFIQEQDEMFIVNLKLQLEKRKVKSPAVSKVLNP